MLAFVDNYEDLKALLESKEDLLSIGVNGTITWPERPAGIFTDRGNADKVVNIFPGRKGTPRFDMSAVKWRGWGPDSDPLQIDNGITVRNKEFAIHGIPFVGFNSYGAALRFSGQNIRFADVNACQFIRCGTLVLEPKGGWDEYRSDDHASVGGYYVPNSQCWFYTCPISGQNLAGAMLTIEESLFEDSALNAWAWAHNVYASAERGVFMRGNRHVRCGNPYAVGGGEYSKASIYDEVIEYGALCPDRYRGYRRPYITLTREPDFKFIRNKVVGAVSEMHEAPFSMSSAIHYDHNDYSGAWLEPNYREMLTWCKDGDTKQYRTQDEWRKAGFDANSEPMP